MREEDPQAIVKKLQSLIHSRQCAQHDKTFISHSYFTQFYQTTLNNNSETMLT